MQDLVSQLTGSMVLSDRAVRQLARVKAAQRKHFQAHGREPTGSELADATGLPDHQVDCLVAAQRRARSLDEPVARDSDAGAAIVDTLPDPGSEHAYDRVSELVAAEQLPRMLGELSDRERVVVRGRYGLDGDEQTLRELAEDLGMSAERVRQIEGAALRKLRDVALPEPA
jgi:RNA polymerase sigma factor (sigma-70 family)